MSDQGTLLEPLLQKEGPAHSQNKNEGNFLIIAKEILSDITLWTLLAAAVISLVIGICEDSEKSLFDGIAILIAATIWIVVLAILNSKKQILIKNCANGAGSIKREIQDQNSSLMQEENGAEVSLPMKLHKISSKIGIVGLIVALLIFGTLIIYLVIDSINNGWTSDFLRNIISSLVFSMIIIVIAYPEGLSLSMTLSLIYAVNKLKQKNILIKSLKALEAIGQTTEMLIDESGTLAKSTMEVAAMYCEKRHIETIKPSDFNPSVKALLCEHFCYNTAGSITYEIENGQKKEKATGSATDIALLKLLNDFDSKYAEAKNPNLISLVVPFNSRLKRMVTILKKGEGYIVLVKGASEIVLEKCSKIVGKDGNEHDIEGNEKEKIRHTIEDYANKAYRTLILAYKHIEKDFPIMNDKNEANLDELETNLVFLCICGFGKPARDEASVFVETCQNSGISVRIFTGDSATSAVVSAKKCRILPEGYTARSGDDTVMQGSEFRQRVGGLIDDPSHKSSKARHKKKVVSNFDEFVKIVGKLRVLARSTPEDKIILVAGLRQLEETVAVIGSDTSNAPALKFSNVGIALHESGADIAKEAADVILLDNHLANISALILWGRNIYDSIRKFIQFQLTVNIVALVLSLIGAIATGKLPFTVVQMLWINLIMDAFAAIALASEQQNKLEFKRAEDCLVTPDMMKNIIGQSIYQIAWLLVIMFFGPDIFGVASSFDTDTDWTEENGVHLTIFFNAFFFLQLFNEINCRKLKSSEINVLQGLFTSWIFLSVITVTTIAQIFLVTFGGKVIGCSPLTLEQHGICIAIGLGGLLYGILIRLIPGLSFKCFKISGDRI